MKSNFLPAKVLFMIMLTTIAATSSFGQKSRNDIPDKYKWNLTDIYNTDADWRTTKDNLTLRLADVPKYKGTLTRSAKDLLAYLEFNSKVMKEASKLYLYANLNADLDTRDMKYSGMKQEMMKLFSDFGAAAAFVEPEILTADWKVIDEYIKSEPKLEVYRMSLGNMFRSKAHTLGEGEEKLLAMSAMVSGWQPLSTTLFPMVKCRHQRQPCRTGIK